MNKTRSAGRQDQEVMGSSNLSRGLWGGALIVIIGITVLAYLPLWSNGFVDIDDPSYITENHLIQQGLSKEGIVRVFSEVMCGNWHPLTMWSHMLDCQLFGLDARGHHGVNLLLHVMNAMLIFGIFNRITGDMGKSFVLALLFAVHPLRVESVVWASERKDVLSGMFWWLTVWAYVGYTQRASAGRYLWVLLLLALGLLSKPMLVTLPAVLLLLDYWPLNRLREKHSLAPIDMEQNRSSLSWGKLLAEKIPLFFTIMASCVMTIYAQRQAMVENEGIGLWSRWSNAFTSYIHYMEKTLFPRNLAVFYPLPTSRSSWEIYACVLVMIVITVLVIYGRKKRPFLLVGWLWFVGTLVPVIGLVQVGSQAYADRYTYIPGVGLLIMSIWGIDSILPRWCLKNTLVVGVVVIMVAILGMVTGKQVGIWKDCKSLWEHALKITKNNHVAAKGVGDCFSREGKYDEAIALLRQSVAWLPTFAEGQTNLSATLFLQGNFEEALIEGQKALPLEPGNYRVLNNMGVILENQGRWAEALTYYEQSSRANPDFKPTGDKITLLTAKKTQLEQMLANYQSQKPEESAAECAAQLGLMAYQRGYYEQAVFYFRKALYAQANNPTALNGLAWLRAACPEDAWRNRFEAVRWAERLRVVAGNTPPATILDTLAAAYAEAGRFDEAVATAQKAILKADEENDANLAEDISRRLELYRAGKPYRENPVVR